MFARTYMCKRVTYVLMHACRLRQIYRWRERDHISTLRDEEAHRLHPEIERPGILHHRPLPRVSIIREVKDKRTPRHHGHEQPCHLLNLRIGQAVTAAHYKEALRHARIIGVDDAPVQRSVVAQ